MSDHCGSKTADGNAVCMPGVCTCSSGANNKPVILSLPMTHDKKSTAVDDPLEKNDVAENS